VPSTHSFSGSFNPPLLVEKDGRIVEPVRSSANAIANVTFTKVFNFILSFSPIFWILLYSKLIFQSYEKIFYIDTKYPDRESSRLNILNG
jgi:hypothetical protein